jgi:hypothetical protein
VRRKGLGNANSVGLEGLGKQRANYGERDKGGERMHVRIYEGARKDGGRRILREAIYRDEGWRETKNGGRRKHGGMEGEVKNRVCVVVYLCNCE